MSDRIKTSPLFSAGYGIIPKIVMQDAELHITAKALYAYFCSFAGSGDSCFPSRGKICKDLGITANTFCKYLKQLTERGYITAEQVKENGRFSHTVYTLNGSPCIKTSYTVMPYTKQTDAENTVYGNAVYDRMTPNNNSNIINISNNNSIKNEQMKKRFTPPTVEEVKAYCDERRNGIDAQRFVDYYTANGWVQGKDKAIKDWRACVRTWERRQERTNEQTTDKIAEPQYTDPFEYLEIPT